MVFVTVLYLGYPSNKRCAAKGIPEKIGKNQCLKLKRYGYHFCKEE
jgi:hypothetical protein